MNGELVSEEILEKKKKNSREKNRKKMMHSSDIFFVLPPEEENRNKKNLEYFDFLKKEKIEKKIKIKSNEKDYIYKDAIERYEEVCREKDRFKTTYSAFFSGKEKEFILKKKKSINITVVFLIVEKLRWSL